ncbi:phosphatase PAP2 family protein [Acidipila rosea]|nr:phosphatase PAP2 family protein [Acidipila rosea]MBW4026928.1 phosphatase PAP2 family protein [Acidobacteriota bacterium]MBW4044996.1 phosphatase PAP2 family protein [Acidobacteriota bacterium]
MFRRLSLFLGLIFLSSSLLYGQSETLSAEDCGITALVTCAKMIGQDQLGIVTSPLRTTPKDLLWIVPFGVAMGLGLDYDAHAMRTLGVDPSRENKFKKVSDYGGLYGPAASAAIGYFLGAKTGNSQLRDTGVLAGEAMVDATIVDQAMKYAIDRERPNTGDGTGRFWPHGLKTWPDGGSMPSEHTMNVWAFAHVVAAQYDGWRTRLAVYSLATTVSASRVMARDHFPSDVVVGSTFGYLIGGFVVRHRSPEKRYFSLSTVNTANGRGLQLSYNFAR